MYYIYHILYDIYNGNSLGGFSLYLLIQDNKMRKQIDTYFSNFFDVEIVNQIKRMV
jgi:hypothetical protein